MIQEHKIKDRLCNICNLGKVEDECHFLFECSAYESLRDNWLVSILNTCPDFHYLELKDQLKCIFDKCPRPTAKFVKSCLDLRKTVLYG